jgi:hypothetical protein
MQFDKTMYESFISKMDSYSFCVENPSVIKNVLKKQAAAQGVHLSAHYHHYVNVCEEVGKLLRTDSPPTLQRACEMLGVKEDEPVCTHVDIDSLRYM